jgi:hypothetical protein
MFDIPGVYGKVCFPTTHHLFQQVGELVWRLHRERLLARSHFAE